MCSHPTVVIGRKGAYRGVHYSPEPCFVIDTAFYLEPKSEIDVRWAYYHLLTQDINAMDSGSAIPSTSREEFYNLSVRVPPLPEQRAIAHILGTLDDKIELNRRMSETLEEMARALFKAWFVDFEPVRAKMEGRWRRGESLPGLPARLYDLFPARLMDSELGEIPEGWEMGTLGDVAELLRDSENPSDSPDALFSHFSIPAFDEGQWPKLEHGENIKSQKWRVPPGVVLLSKLNPEIERVWLVDVQPCDRAVCSTEFLVLAPRGLHGRSYVYCAARSPVFRQELERLVTGTSKSHQRAQVSAILGLRVVLPPAQVLKQFDKAAGPLLARTLECRRESRALAALRDALLPKLISGEIRVKDAERFTVEVS
jgi:type I restriction enzyme S subunit